MTTFSWKPLRLTLDLERQIENAFVEVIHQPWRSHHSRTSWEPALDLYETDDAYLIEAELPGVRPDDVKVHVEDRWLTISGKRQSTAWIESARGLLLERRHGSFSRTFQLDCPVDPNEIEHRHSEGIYYIRLLKKKRADVDE